MPKRLTIKEAEKRYPDLARGQVWTTARKKYQFNCKIHGNYPQTFKSHSQGHRCPKCSQKRNSSVISIDILRRALIDAGGDKVLARKMLGISRACFYRKLKLYDIPRRKYQLLIAAVAEKRCPDMLKGQKWKGTKRKYWFHCFTHGKYLQNFNAHHRGHRCPKCWKSSGSVFIPNPVQHRPDGVSVLTLERRDGTTLNCFIDTPDYPRVVSYRWSAHKSKKGRTFYAHSATKRKGHPIAIHTLLLQGAISIDHRDRNGLNNRRSNLRSATASQNAANRPKPHRAKKPSSRFQGVRVTKTGYIVAYIGCNRKVIYLGAFPSEIDAARAYDAAAMKYFGDFACLNFPKTEAL